LFVYLVAQLHIDDRERYSQYEAGFMPIFQKHGGELLAIDDSPVVMEGETDITRLVVLRFPDQEKADAWFHSDEYQAIAAHRRAASTATLVSGKGIG
jgi:uncharacterized protein (DUF1330 family)